MAICTFKAMAKAAASHSGQPAEEILRKHMQQLSVTLRCLNACAVFRRKPAAIPALSDARFNAAFILAPEA